jgi:hypothetical protein
MNPETLNRRRSLIHPTHVATALLLTALAALYLIGKMNFH